MIERRRVTHNKPSCFTVLFLKGLAERQAWWAPSSRNYLISDFFFLPLLFRLHVDSDMQPRRAKAVRCGHWEVFKERHGAVPERSARFPLSVHEQFMRTERKRSTGMPRAGAASLGRVLIQRLVVKTGRGDLFSHGTVTWWACPGGVRPLRRWVKPPFRARLAAFFHLRLALCAVALASSATGATTPLSCSWKQFCLSRNLQVAPTRNTASLYFPFHYPDCLFCTPNPSDALYSRIRI